MLEERVGLTQSTDPIEKINMKMNPIELTQIGRCSVVWTICSIAIGLSGLALAEPNSNGTFSEKMRLIMKMKTDAKNDLFRRVNLAQTDESVDVNQICLDIKDAHAAGVFGMSDIPRLIEDIDFPDSANKIPVRPRYIFGASDWQSPFGSVLTGLGKTAADECLNQLKISDKVGRKETELYTVVRMSYGEESVQKLKDALGAGNKVFIELTKYR